MRLKDASELVHDFGAKTSCEVRCNSKVLQMSSCSLQLFTRHSSWFLCVIVADLTAHARVLNSLRNHTCFLSKLIFDSDLPIFLWIRMMDPGKKRMITLKKSERDRKKLNESILKKLKTLDAEVAGASIVSWFLHSFSREPGIMLSCSNGLWEPNSFMWSVWTIEKMIVATKCFVLWEKMEPKLREVYLTSSKIRLFELHLFVAKCHWHFALTTKISNNKFLPVQDIIWPHFLLLKQSHSISEVLLSWLLSGLSCIFWGSYIFVPPFFFFFFFSALRGEIFMLARA